MKLRDRFDENKYERDQRKVLSILQAAEAEFEKMKHPFPYTRKCLVLLLSGVRVMFEAAMKAIQPIQTLFMYSPP